MSHNGIGMHATTEVAHMGFRKHYHLPSTMSSAQTGSTTQSRRWYGRRSTLSHATQGTLAMLGTTKRKEAGTKMLKLIFDVIVGTAIGATAGAVLAWILMG